MIGISTGKYLREYLRSSTTWLSRADRYTQPDRHRCTVRTLNKAFSGPEAQEGLTATLLTHVLTPAQLPPEAGDEVVGEGALLVGDVLVGGTDVGGTVAWGAEVGGGGALDPPKSALLTPASNRPLSVMTELELVYRGKSCVFVLYAWLASQNITPPNDE